MLKESEAWRMIGEAFEAKVAHPELPDNDAGTDLAESGLCLAVTRSAVAQDIANRMDDRVQEYGQHFEWGFFAWRKDPEGNANRAALAYLFAEASR